MDIVCERGGRARTVSMFGGVIRVVYANPERYRSYMAKMRAALGHLHETSCLQLLASARVPGATHAHNPFVFVEQGTAGDSNQGKDRVGSGLVVQDSVHPYDLSIVTSRLASFFVYCLVAGALWSRLDLDGQGTNKRYAAMFELLSASKIAAGGVFQTARLSEKGKRSKLKWVEVEHEDRLLSLVPGGVQSFLAAWAAADGSAVLCPSVRNMPAVDFVTTRVEAFQSTVSMSHPISGYGCAEQLLALGILQRDRKGQLKRVNKGVRLNVYFVVPKRRLEQNSNELGVQQFTWSTSRSDGEKMDSSSSSSSGAGATGSRGLVLSEADKKLVRDSVQQWVMPVECAAVAMDSLLADSSMLERVIEWNNVLDKEEREEERR